MSGPYLEVLGAGGTCWTASLSIPAKGQGPGLVLVPDAARTPADYRAIAGLFAEEGYAVAALDAAPPPGVAWSVAALDETRKALQARPECTVGVAAIGFGVGGALTFQAARLLPFAAAVVFDADLDDLVAATASSPCPLLLHLAGGSARVPTERGRKLRAALRGWADVSVQEYAGAAPGFYVPGHAAYQPLTAQYAHSRTIMLPRRALGPRYDLESLWDAHLDWEFNKVDAAGTMSTMTADPFNLNVGTLTGGIGYQGVLRYYREQFLGQLPSDAHIIPISRTIGADRVVDEHLLCFTHDRAMDAMLPGIAPTGKYVEFPVVVIVIFRGDKVFGEHIHWDQASLLAQIGKLDPTGLPIAGADAARRIRDEGLPIEILKQRWGGRALT
jgi:carboxymethylenebutenolidase